MHAQLEPSTRLHGRALILVRAGDDPNDHWAERSAQEFSKL